MAAAAFFDLDRTLLRRSSALALAPAFRAAGLTSHYRELKPGEAPRGAAALAGHTGNLAEYIAGEVDKGVARALAAYGTFYRTTKT